MSQLCTRCHKRPATEERTSQTGVVYVPMCRWCDRIDRLQQWADKHVPGYRQLGERREERDAARYRARRRTMTEEERRQLGDEWDPDAP